VAENSANNLLVQFYFLILFCGGYFRQKIIQFLKKNIFFVFKMILIKYRNLKNESPDLAVMIVGWPSCFQSIES
jgi:UDP-N-acetylglucosamine:LPS N-acetylglucosamine transferase